MDVTTTPAATAPNARKPLSRRLQNIFAAYSFLAPFLLVLACFTLIAFIYAFYLSFYKVDFGFTEPKFVGLNNYKFLFQNLQRPDDIFRQSLINVLKYTVGVVTVQTVVALLMAVLLNQPIRAKGFFRTAFYLPSLTSSVAISLIFLWLYNEHGAINALLGALHLPTNNWLNDPNTALPSIMLLNIWTTAPTFMLLYLAALQDIPESIYEAARIDGVNGWQMLTQITVPLLRPTTFLVVALGTIGAFQVFDQVYVMQGAQGGPLGSTNVPALDIYTTAFLQGQMGMACAEAVILFIVIFTFTVLQRRFIDANVQY